MRPRRELYDGRAAGSRSMLGSVPGLASLRRLRVYPFIFAAFILGAYFSAHIFPPPPVPIYQPPNYDDDPDSRDPFLPPDAPPLNRMEDEGQDSRREDDFWNSQVKRTNSDYDNGSEEEMELLMSDGEIFGMSLPTSESTLEVPSYFFDYQGYLYYPARAPLVSMSIPLAPHRSLIGSGLNELSLTKPKDARTPKVTPSFPPYTHPEAFFKKRTNSAPVTPAPARGVGRGGPITQPQQLLQAGAGRRVPQGNVNPRARQELARPPAVAIPGLAQQGQDFRGPDGKRLGPNAAAMARAERENLPFVPKMPAEIVLERKARKQQAELDKKLREGNGGAAAAAAAVAGRAGNWGLPRAQPLPPPTKAEMEEEAKNADLRRQAAAQVAFDQEEERERLRMREAKQKAAQLRAAAPQDWKAFDSSPRRGRPGDNLVLEMTPIEEDEDLLPGEEPADLDFGTDDFEEDEEEEDYETDPFVESEWHLPEVDRKPPPAANRRVSDPRPPPAQPVLAQNPRGPLVPQFPRDAQMPARPPPPPRPAPARAAPARPAPVRPAPVRPAPVRPALQRPAAEVQAQRQGAPKGAVPRPQPPRQAAPEVPRANAVGQAKAKAAAERARKAAVDRKGGKEPARPRLADVVGGRQGAGRGARQKRSFDVEEPADELSATSDSILIPTATSEVVSESSTSPATPPPPPKRLAKRALDPSDSEETDSEEFDTDIPPPTLSTGGKIHPISFLLYEADKTWKQMLRRQSQSLADAVAEYQRRYGRRPPRGFDRWWRYAMQNRIILVDEYDQINSDIEPLLALSPREVRQRANILAASASLPFRADTFTIEVRDGMSSAGGAKKTVPRVEDVEDLMSEFVEVLPDALFVFTSHSLPVVTLSGESRVRNENHVRNGLRLAPSQENEILENRAYPPWQSLCRPNSTARRVTSGEDVLGGPQAPSFISLDHVSAMDMCQHPEIQYQHGFTSWEGPRPHLLYPVFSWSKTSMHGDMLLPGMDSYYAEVGPDPEWDAKQHDKVLWRGKSTGTYAQDGQPWRWSQRDRLVTMTSAREGTRDVRYADEEAGDLLRRFSGPTDDVNGHYFDVAFAGPPIQCDVEADLCHWRSNVMRFTASMTKAEQNEYKYILDVDGNGPSPDFHRLMSSNSLVFKSTIFEEWWAKRLVPWYHYVPIKTDYSDLTDVAAFFIGAPDGRGAHDEAAKKIAANGKKWADEHWREVDMAAYQFRMYLEYARVIGRTDDDAYDFIME